jgi:hypothetical protein
MSEPNPPDGSTYNVSAVAGSPDMFVGVRVSSRVADMELKAPALTVALIVLAVLAGVVVVGGLMTEVFEGARLVYFGAQFSDATVTSAALVRCLLMVFGLLVIIWWATSPGLLLLVTYLPERISPMGVLKAVLTGLIVLLLVLAFTGVMVRYFGLFFIAATVVYVVARAVSVCVRWANGKNKRRPPEPAPSESESALVTGTGIAGIAVRAALVLLLAAFVSGRHTAMHQESYRVGNGTHPCVVLANQGDQFLCTDLPRNGGQTSYISKTKQQFTVQGLVPVLLPFGIWDTPWGRDHWSWARTELQRE